jgi:hypothetical protein
MPHESETNDSTSSRGIQDGIDANDLRERCDSSLSNKRQRSDSEEYGSEDYGEHVFADLEEVQ